MNKAFVGSAKFILAVFILVTLFSCEFKSTGYHITGTIKNIIPGSKIILEELDYNAIIQLDSTKPDKNGRFELKGFLKHEGLYRLHFNANNFVLLVLNEKKQQIDIQGDASGSFMQHPYVIKGSGLSNQIQDLLLNEISRNTAMAGLFEKMNDSIHPVSDSLKKVYKTEIEKQSAAARAYLTAYVDTVADPVIGVFAAYYYMDPRMDFPVAAKLADRLKKNYPDLPISKAFVENVAEMQRQMAPTDQPMFANGKHLPDIEINNINNKPIKLSSLRGNYVLVDFWASWCGPCRAENPNIVKAYNEFKDKGFTVFSVSLDDDYSRWTKAIEKDKLAWPSHVSELKGWHSNVCQQFGITAIPTNYLIDKQGKVIASDLRGNELENILTQTLK